MLLKYTHQHHNRPWLFPGARLPTANGSAVCHAQQVRDIVLG